MKEIFQGERIRLTALVPEDAETLASWFSDSEFVRHWDSKAALPRTVASAATQYIGEDNPWEEIGFAIRSADGKTLLGLVGIEDIEWQNRVAYMYIGLGERSVWGKGYASEAMELFLTYIFNELNFHRIQLQVISYNTSAIKLYDKFGFVREGVLREAVERDGQRFDLIHFGLLRTEWNT